MINLPQWDKQNLDVCKGVSVSCLFNDVFIVMCFFTLDLQFGYKVALVGNIKVIKLFIVVLFFDSCGLKVPRLMQAKQD